MTDGVEPVAAIYRSQAGERNPIIYFNTDDIDATLARIRELGGEAEEKQPIPSMGWYARAKDSEGNTIAFFQSDESAPAPEG
jgi:predicted enzyme related to lactoylglutathione lyase